MRIFVNATLGLVTLIFPVLAAAQNQANVWHFGSGRSIDFNSGEPVLVPGSQIASYEGTTSYCDVSGNLLYYTDGFSKIWNANNEVMYEIQDDEGGGYSAMQPGVVTEVPGRCGSYYLFTMEEEEAYPAGKGLRYFTIDMNANGGLGAVTASTEVFTPSFEGICAIRHANGYDHWIVINQANLGLGVYSVTEDGVAFSSLYAIDQLGTKGLIKASPDGSRVFVKAAESAPLNSLSAKGLLFDFDNTTGVLSNLQELVAEDDFLFFEFSPNSDWLYVDDLTGLARFDLQAVDINASVTYLFPGAGQGAQMQLGPDGSLYRVSVVYDDTTGISTIAIDRILQPDAVEPEYDPAVFSFPGTDPYVVEFIGLPNFPAWIFRPGQEVPVDLQFTAAQVPCERAISVVLDEAAQVSRLVLLINGQELPVQPGLNTYPVEPGIFEVTLQYGNFIACVDPVTVTVQVEDPVGVYVPNAFTPNGDGFNERFIPIAPEQDDRTALRIFNRWGQELFATDDLGRGWDGTAGGEPVPDGVYTYQLTVRTPCELTKQAVLRGHVTVLR